MRRLPLLCVVALAGVAPPTVTLQAEDVPLKVPMPATQSFDALRVAMIYDLSF